MRFAADLRAIRESRNISFEKVRQEIKVPSGILQEFEETALLDHPMYNRVYLRSLLRSYAEVIGVSDAVALDALDEALEGRYSGRLLGAEGGADQGPSEEETDASAPEPEGRSGEPEALVDTDRVVEEEDLQDGRHSPQQLLDGPDAQDVASTLDMEESIRDVDAGASEELTDRRTEKTTTSVDEGPAQPTETEETAAMDEAPGATPGGIVQEDVEGRESSLDEPSSAAVDAPTGRATETEDESLRHLDDGSDTPVESGGVASRNDQDSGGVLSARGGEANADTVKQPFEATEVESGAEPALEIDSVPESTPEIPDVPDAPLPSDVDTLDSGETEAAESAPESPEEDEERPEDAPSRVARAVDPEQPAPRDERLEASGAGDVSGVIEQGETLTLPFEESPEESVEEELDEEGSDSVGRIPTGGRSSVESGAPLRRRALMAVVASAGVVAVIVLFLVLRSEPAAQEPEVAVASDTVEVALPPPLVAGDTVLITIVAATDRLEATRIGPDGAWPRRYWVNLGDSISFSITDSLFIQNHLDKMTIIIDSLEYPKSFFAQEPRLTISRRAIQSYLDSIQR